MGAQAPCFDGEGEELNADDGAEGGADGVDCGGERGGGDVAGY